MQKLLNSIEIPYLPEAVAFLITVVIIVPICKRIRLSPIIGFLAVGACIGPYNFALVTNPENVQHFAELGVIFLLFTIGLELSFERLKSFAKTIFGVGSAYVCLCAVAISATAYLWGNSIQASILIGLCLSLSSTAIVMQLLAEKRQSASAHGRTAFAVLLFQDLAVVPILILVSIFGNPSTTNIVSVIGLAILKAATAIAIIILFGRFVLRYVFRYAALAKAVEVFMAMTLLAIMTISILTGAAGLSMALGAFLAGLLLAETEYRHQIETDIEPFKGLLLGLFFMGVGMNLNFGLAFERGIWVLLSVFGLLAIKTIIGTAVCLTFKIKPMTALRSSLLLAEAGEFAFVVIGQASLTYKVIPVDVGQFMVVVAGLSMMLTPALAMLGTILQKQSEQAENNISVEVDLHDHVIIAGYGRVGKTVAEALITESLPYIAIDNSATSVTNRREKSEPVYFGDASKKSILRSVGADRAKAILITIDDAATTSKILAIIKREWPTIPIIVRAKDTSHSQELLKAGATTVIPETLEASLQLASSVLQSCDYPREEADACIELMRRKIYQI